MTRVRRFNARKDCLVCIVGVIAGGHYDQGRDLNAKLHDHYFIFNGFASETILSLICLLHIKTDVDDDNYLMVMMMTKEKKMLRTFSSFDDDDDDDVYCCTVVLMIHVLFELYIACINKQNYYCTVTDDDQNINTSDVITVIISMISMLSAFNPLLGL